MLFGEFIWLISACHWARIIIAGEIYSYHVEYEIWSNALCTYRVSRFSLISLVSWIKRWPFGCAMKLVMAFLLHPRRKAVGNKIWCLALMKDRWISFWDTKDISNWGSREIPTQLQHSQMMEFLLENSANDGLTYCYAAIYLINLLNRFTFLWIVSIVSSVKSICASEINQRESTWIILQKIKGKKKHSMIEVGATFLR